ncbi:MAG: DUF5717 family protein [bacterium]|nr:DUF5717 family protein [bacterium]
MYKRMEQLAIGKVNNELPVVAFVPEVISIEPVEGKDTAGSFTIKSLNGLPMKGMIYSSDLRMEIKNPQFQGTQAEIHYEFHGTYMHEGETVKGCFHVISNGGEYDLFFDLTIRRLYAETSIGRIATIQDFVRLYQVNWQESVHVFAAPAFRKLLTNTNERLYYKLFSVKPIARNHIEEFLIACGYKKRVTFSVSGLGRVHEQLSEVIEETIELSNSDWGYIDIKVSCDNPFVELEKERITSDDFHGRSLTYRYQIHPHRMHAGKNFAQITFENHNQRETFTIEASTASVADLDREERMRLTREDLYLAEYYEQFLAGEIVLGEWANQTTKLLTGRREKQEHTDMDALWCAYAYTMNHQYQEASWILDEYAHRRKESDSSEWTFYLFLCTLTEKEPKLKEKLFGSIRDRYRRNQSDAWHRFIIMQIAQNSPEDVEKQVDLLHRWFFRGMTSPFLYAKAAQLYIMQPYLMTKLDQFERAVLIWMRRHHMFSRDLAEQVVRHIGNVREYDKRMDEILKYIYEQYPQEEMLTAVCAYRIKGQRFELRNHEWYALAVEHDLQIAGLYEAFMASLDTRCVHELPRSVQLYFQYNNHLTYRQKAVLYVNIIAHRDSQPAIYERYVPIMQEFVIREILAGHIDDNLAVVYAHMLERMPLTQELAKALSSILYVNKFTCIEEPVAQVIVMHEHLASPGVYPVVKRQAYIPVFSGNYVVVLVDASGMRYAMPTDSQMERLMNPGKYIRKCLALAPDELPYVLHHMNGKTKMLHIDEQMAGYIRTLVESDRISQEYKSEIGPGFFEYCRGEGRSIDSSDYMLRIDFGLLDQNARDRYLASLIHMRMYKEAWAFLIQYGTGMLDLESLQQVVLVQLQNQLNEEDEHLLYMSMQCFVMGSRKRTLIEYLINFYQGPSEHLLVIWEEAQKLQLAVHDLEERLLIQVMFTGKDMPELHSVFSSYCSTTPREQVRIAYLTYFSYKRFVNRIFVEPEFYVQLEQAVRSERRATDYMKLALLEYYTSIDPLTSAQEHFVDDMLDVWMAKGLLFESFLHLPERILVRHHLYDLCIVEFCPSSKDAQVFLDYRIVGEQEEYEELQLEPVMDGFFVWSCRLMADQQIAYRIREKSARMERITETRSWSGNMMRLTNNNRFARLADMEQMIRSGETQKLHAQAVNYEVYQNLSNKLFRIVQN